MSSGQATDDPGARLMGQSAWLALLFAHLAGHKVRARVEVDDLVQETLLRAFGAPAGLPPAEPGEAALRRLLAHIARHCVMDVLRQMRAKKRAGQEVRLRHADWSTTGLSASQLADPSAGPVTRVGLADEQRAWAAAFDGLSAEHRRVIGLRQFEGLDARETGRRMGRSATAVHSLYRRALTAWHDAMG